MTETAQKTPYTQDEHQLAEFMFTSIYKQFSGVPCDLCIIVLIELMAALVGTGAHNRESADLAVEDVAAAIKDKLTKNWDSTRRMHALATEAAMRNLQTAGTA
jgi:hypothetical protein